MLNTRQNIVLLKSRRPCVITVGVLVICIFVLKLKKLHFLTSKQISELGLHLHVKQTQHLIYFEISKSVQFFFDILFFVIVKDFVLDFY